MTQPEGTELAWPECRNVRDVGGLPSGSGVIRAGVLVRSGQHAALTASGREALEAYGVGRIIDLRRRGEVGSMPSPFATDSRYVHLPVDGAPASDTMALEEIYRGHLEASAPSLATALARIADAPRGATVVHCHAGKDRTGLVVALALDVVGVDPEVIAAEYARTDRDPRTQQAVAAYLTTIDDPHARARWRRLLSAPAEVMLATLDHVRRVHGSSRRYLETGGFTRKAYEALHARLVTHSFEAEPPYPVL